jgi:hypothetical protein
MRCRVLALAVSVLMIGCSTPTTPVVSTNAATNSPASSTAVTSVSSIYTESTEQTPDSLPSAPTIPQPENGWSPQPIGTIDAALGAVTYLAFGPDGAAVAIALIDRSCCSNDVLVWFRRGGVWSPSVSSTDVFVKDAAGRGTLGGPAAVVWSKDRFIAIGQRGGTADTGPAETGPADNGTATGTSTTWTSVDGSTWTALDEPTRMSAVGLTPALDGTGVIGAWAQDGGPIALRKTVDGTSWMPIGELKGKALGTHPSARLLHTLPTAKATSGRYVLVGNTESSLGYLATSADGTTWSISVLPGLPDKQQSSASEVVKFGDNIDDIIVYGEAFGQDDRGEPTQAAVGWRRSTDGTYRPFVVDAPCDGRLDDVSVDPSDASRLLAICSSIDEAVEGDFVATITDLVTSTEGKMFVPLAPTPTVWGRGSSDVVIGPLVVDEGSVSVGVSSITGDERRTAVLWAR